LLAQGKNKEAADLLAGTRESAQHILDMQKQAASAQGQGGKDTNSADGQKTYNEYVAASNELKRAGVVFTEKEVQAQETLGRAREAQATVQDKVNALKHLQDSNARKTTQDTLNDEAFQRFKKAAEAERQGLEIAEKIREEAHRVRSNSYSKAKRKRL